MMTLLFALALQDPDAILKKFDEAKPKEADLAIFQLDWEPDFAKAKARAKKENRPLLFIWNTNITGPDNLWTGHCRASADLVRGYVLSHASVLEAMRPWVITHWNGWKKEEMPSEIRAICESWKEGDKPGPIRFFFHDRDGKIVKVLTPEGPPLKDRRAPLEKMHEYLLGELKVLRKGLEGVGPKKDELHLPDVPGGVRIYLTTRPRNRPVFNYKAPTVEVVAATEEERKALEHPARETTVEAAKLRGWLEQIYPPSIMDKTGKVLRVEGTLTFKPADKRRATLTGEVVMTLDDNAKTVYRGTLEIVLTYGEGAAYTSLRGVYRGMYPKADRMRDQSIEHDLVAAIESRPE